MDGDGIDEGKGRKEKHKVRCLDLQSVFNIQSPATLFFESDWEIESLIVECSPIVRFPFYQEDENVKEFVFYEERSNDQSNLVVYDEVWEELVNDIKSDIWSLDCVLPIR